MEKLSLDDRPPMGLPPPQQLPGVLGMAPPAAPQLPPQMFTTAAQLLNLTDKKLLVILRDGRKFTGVLRSWDQFANLVLQDTTERMFAQDMYADVRHGVYIVRGENVLLLGEIDLDQEDTIPEPFHEAPVEKVRELMRAEADKKKKKDAVKAKLLRTRGFEGDIAGEAIV